MTGSGWVATDCIVCTGQSKCDNADVYTWDFG